MNPEYVCDDYASNCMEDAKAILDKYGVAIITGVLDSTSCSKLEDDMWNMLEQLSIKFKAPSKPITRTDPSSWKEISRFYPIHNMLIQQHVGHSVPVWNVRQHPNVVGSFAKLWDVNSTDLLTSFDGISFHMPPETTKRGWFKNNWLHCDQSFTRNDRDCVQGWVTARDINDGDGTLTFLEGSHKYHKTVAEHFSLTDKKDWLKLDPCIVDYYTNDLKCAQKCIKCPKGSLVLWDSRTIHSGREASKTRLVPNIRCVIYVCMTPRQNATAACLRKRIKAYEESRMTTHCPHNPKLFGKHPRTYGGELYEMGEIDAHEITDVGRRLIGYD